MTEHRESPAGNSQLSLFSLCPRKWAFKYLLGFQTTGQSLPLNLGSAIHEAQETFYLTGSLDQALDKGRAILIDYGYEEDSFAMQRMTISLDTWCYQYGSYDYDTGAVLEVEKEYPLKLLNGYVMTIRVDSRMKDSDGTYIRDTKTTGGQAMTTMHNYMVNPQPVLYIEALLQAGSTDLNGWRTDVISSRVNKGGPVCQCIRSDLVMPTPLRREDVIFSYTDLTDRIAYAIMQHEQGVPFRIAFPCNPKSCMDYNRLCPHYSHCSKVEHTRIPDEFTLDPWLDERTVLKTFDILKEE